MKVRYYIFILSILLVTFLVCCSDNLYLDIPEPDDKIVIDGWIDQGQYAKVLLTRNSPFFSSIDSASLRELVLTRAKVMLSDGEKEEVLVLRKNDDYFPPYIYEGNEIRGDTAKIYTITAEYGGKSAWANTTIPPRVNLDTLYFKLLPDEDSLGEIYIEFTDPPEVKNYYRLLTKVSGEDKRYYSSMVMGFDDIFFSGQKFGFSLSRGKASLLSSQGNDYFKLGDTVSIKFCTIDKVLYDFWNSFQGEAINVGNPFAASLSGIKSNIQGDGLGVWGGYGTRLYTLILK